MDSSRFSVPALPNGWNAEKSLTAFLSCFFFFCIRGGVEYAVVEGVGHRVESKTIDMVPRMPSRGTGSVRDSWGPSLRAIQGTAPLVNESG